MPAAFTSVSPSGLIVVQPRALLDNRGEFFETYKRSEYAANGVTEDFVQDNHSVSVQGVLRGLHWQRSPHAQGKLVRVVVGAVWDVAVDLRADSPTFGTWFGIELSAQNRTQLYIPAGFAHGFVTLSDTAEFLYKCTAEYDRASEAGIRWDDPDLGITWPAVSVDYIVSEKDALLPRLKEVRG